MPLGGGPAVGAGAGVRSWRVASTRKAGLAPRSQSCPREQNQKYVLLTKATPGLEAPPEASISFSEGANFAGLEGAKSHPWLTRNWCHSRVPHHPSPK